jgi:uncharacterized delta-60 repeat protein
MVTWANKSGIWGIVCLSLILWGCGGGGGGGSKYLDTSFGENGLVATPLGIGSGARALALQADGKLVAAGESSSSGSPIMTLARYNTDGSLDPTFNTTGVVTTPQGQVTALAIQADGKLVAVGVHTIARFDTDGSLDLTFNTTGYVTPTVINSAVAIQSDGKIVAAGSNSITRYNPDGTLDSTFNGSGVVNTSFTFGPNGLAIQSDGKLVVAGGQDVGPGEVFILARYNSDGSLDTTYNGTGSVTTAINSLDEAKALVIQADGKVVASGGTYTGSREEFALVRYNTDGSLDTTFNSTGIVTTTISGECMALALALQSNGKLVAAGWASHSYNSSRDFALARYNSDGSLDTTFNGSGKVTTAIGVDAQAYAVIIQSDGKPVAAGEASNGMQTAIVLARYQP